MTDNERAPVAEHRLTVLSGRRAAQVLASWGLLSLLPGATIHFEGAWCTPVIRWCGDAARLAETAARSLVDSTWNLAQRGLGAAGTTTPLRSVANAVSRAAWDASLKQGRLLGDDVVQSMDLSAVDRASLRNDDPRVRASDLTLLSGRSYTAKSVQDTWDLLAAKDADQAFVRAKEELARLLKGRISVVEAKPGLRFSASEPTPRTTRGSEKCDVQPLIDLLAFRAQLFLQPRQAPVRPSTSRKVLTWTVNPVPLTIEMVVDLHESPPDGLSWPRWSSVIRSTEGSSKVSYLELASREDPEFSEGDRHA